jgi:hypothetical protein
MEPRDLLLRTSALLHFPLGTIVFLYLRHPQVPPAIRLALSLAFVVRYHKRGTDHPIHL